MTSAPSPLTPPECDCRGLPFMPLDVQRLLDSDLFALSTGDEFKAAFSLWGKSWGQVPAASIPSDERILARFAGVSLGEWRALSDMALRGWLLCSDGRLYHPVVAEKAREAWAARLRQRDRAAKRWGGRGPAPEQPAHGDAAEPQHDHGSTADLPQHDEAEPAAMPRHSDGSPAEMQGTGTGTGTDSSDATASVPSDLGSVPVEKAKARLMAMAKEIWELQPVLGGKRRATGPDVARAFASAIKRGGAPADILACCRAYYALPDCTKDGGQYARGADVLLNADRWAEYRPSSDAPHAVPVSWDGPRDVLEAVLAETDDGFVRSYLLTSEWIQPEAHELLGAIRPRTSYAFDKLARLKCLPSLASLLQPAPRSRAA
jgi:hypothetical protein